MADQTVTTIASRPENEQAAMDKLIAAGTGGPALPGGRTFFPGETVAGMTPEQQQGYQMLQNTLTAGPVATGIAQTQASNELLADTNRLLSDPLSIAGVRNFRDATIGDSRRALEEALLPSLDLGAITAGGFGGSRHGVGQALAAEKVAQQAGNALANFDAQLIGQLLQANTGALNRSGQVAALGLLPGQTIADIGQQYQRQNQAEIAGDRERFEFGQNEPYAVQDNLRATLGLGLVNRSQGTDEDKSLGDYLLGAGGILAGSGALDGILDSILGNN